MQLTIDERIRDYIFIPLLLLMFMIGIIKHYVTKLLNSGPAETPKITNSKAMQENRLKKMVARSSKLRLSNSLISAESFAARQRGLADTGNGVLRKAEFKDESDTMDKMLNNPMMNPGSMKGMMKNQLMMTGFQLGQYYLINALFSGFIIGKVPFPLTQTFRGMLQSGVSVIGLDVKYVSSLSLYFLSVFSFGTIYQMMFTGNDIDNMYRGR